MIRMNEISSKVLTASLRSMEEDGIVTRTVYAEVPPRVEYALSELGESMRPVLDAMREWETPTKGPCKPLRTLTAIGWSYAPCYTICFNQDGELLYADMEMAGRAGFAVQGKEIKTLYVYIFDNLDDWSLTEQEGMNSSAADKAVISKEIHVE